MAYHFRSFSQDIFVTPFCYPAQSFAIRALSEEGFQREELQMLPANVLNELVGGIPKAKIQLESEGPIQTKATRFGIPKVNEKQWFCPTADAGGRIMGPVEPYKTPKEIEERKAPIFKDWQCITGNGMDRES